MLLHDFIYLTYNYENLINYLCDMQVLRREIMCPQCRQMVHLLYNSASLILQCTNNYYKHIHRCKRVRKVCNYTVSPFKDTWLNRSIAIANCENVPLYCVFPYDATSTTTFSETTITNV